MAYFFFVAQSSLGGDDGVALQARSTLLGLTLEGGSDALLTPSLARW